MFAVRTYLAELEPLLFTALILSSHVYSRLYSLIQNEDRLCDSLHTALYFQNLFLHTDPSVKVCTACLSEATSVELQVVSSV